MWNRSGENRSGETGNGETGKGKIEGVQVDGGWGVQVGKEKVWGESKRGKAKTDRGEQVMGDQGDT